MKFLTIFLILIFIFNACSSNNQSKEVYFPPNEHELPNAVNCAADGEGCQQFNSNL